MFEIQEDFDKIEVQSEDSYYCPLPWMLLMNTLLYFFSLALRVAKFSCLGIILN